MYLIVKVLSLLFDNKILYNNYIDMFNSGRISFMEDIAELLCMMGIAVCGIPLFFSLCSPNHSTLYSFRNNSISNNNSFIYKNDSLYWPYHLGINYLSFVRHKYFINIQKPCVTGCTNNT